MNYYIQYGTVHLRHPSIRMHEAEGCSTCANPYFTGTYVTDKTLAVSFSLCGFREWGMQESK